MENLINIAKKVLKTEADAVNGLIEKLDSSFEKAVTILYESKGRVVVTGMGKSGLVGKKIAATLSSTGTPAFFMHPGEASHGDLGMVTSDDVIIAITNSGETEEVINLLPFLKRFNVKLIVLTGNAQSTLSRAADAVLNVSVKEEACPLGFVPTSSTTAALAMGDAIAVAILVKRGLKAEDFACYHPSGTLGKKLLTTVTDLMHTGQDLPLISMGTSLPEALIEISSKRLGMTIVADNEKKILGIITDGDIRRGVEKWGKSFFDMDIQDVMSRNPKLISHDELATKALSMMEHYSITSLLISDDKKRALGVIHLHDILRKGIV
jgi:arabinose-5-phosphate isomerase